MSQSANIEKNASTESYSPKKPDILNMAETAKIENMIKNHIVEMDNIRYMRLPALRFIGMDVMAKGENRGAQYGAMWEKSGEFIPVLDSLTEYASEIKEPCALMHHDDKEYNKSDMHYIVGRFMKAETPVPEGFSFYDLPESCAALAIYTGEFGDMMNQMYAMTREKILSDNMGIPYPVGYYHAEVYVKENIPNNGVVSKMGYLFSCSKAE